MEPLDYGQRQYSAGLAFRAIGNGPVLVLIHGGSGSRNHWARNVTALSRHLRVLTVDLPGFGESAAPPPDMTPAEYVQWVTEALGLQLQGRRYHLAGFSFGGAMAAAVAAQRAAQGHAPERLTLVSPAGFGTPPERGVQLEKVNKPGATEDDIRAAVARNLGRWMLAATPAPHDEAVRLHRDNVARARYDSRLVSLRDSTRADVAALGRAGVPVQVLLGESDVLVFPSLAGRMAALREALPGIHIETIAGAGHWLQYEASEAVNRRLTEFHPTTTGDIHAV